MSSVTFVITIDGPAASGKTTVSRMLAERHSWAWVSTGAFYRGLAYVAVRERVSLEDENALAKLCVEKFWQVKMTPKETCVFLRKEDVTKEIYAEEVGSAASKISSYPKVRANLLQAQRDCTKLVDVLVAEGRDCGTVVFPKAQVKIYMTAKSDDRAKRRAQEKGKDIEEMKVAQVIRDQQDSQRKAAPMQIPADAHVIDTSNYDLSQVVDLVDQIVGKELKELESH